MLYQATGEGLGPCPKAEWGWNSLQHTSTPSSATSALALAGSSRSSPAALRDLGLPAQRTTSPWLATFLYLSLLCVHAIFLLAQAWFSGVYLKYSHSQDRWCPVGKSTGAALVLSPPTPAWRGGEGSAFSCDGPHRTLWKTSQDRKWVTKDSQLPVQRHKANRSYQDTKHCPWGWLICTPACGDKGLTGHSISPKPIPFVT